MRTSAVIPLLALALMTIFTTGCAAQEKASVCGDIEKLPPGEHVFCPTVYDPVCGSDGKIYSNICFLCSKIRETGNKLELAQPGYC